MSADILRRAASLMRERAEVATPGPWFLDKGGSTGVFTTPRVTDTSEDVAFCSADYRASEEHIASWHPAVALVVADWLETAASRYEALLDTFAPGSKAGAVTAAENITGWTHAVDLARAYLGEQP